MPRHRLQRADCHHEPIQEIPADIQEQPRQNREVVTGAESRERETERGQHAAVVQPIGQIQSEHARHAQIAQLHILEHHEQCKGRNQTDRRGDPPQHWLHRDHQQYSAADAVEDAKPHRLGGHGQHRHPADHQAPDIQHDATLDVAASPPRPHEPGDQDERPADRLLPDVHGGLRIPGRVAPIDHEYVVAAVEDHHADDGNPADRVDQVITSLTRRHCVPPSSAVSSHTLPQPP